MMMYRSVHHAVLTPHTQEGKEELRRVLQDYLKVKKDKAVALKAKLKSAQVSTCLPVCGSSSYREKHLSQMNT